MRPSVAASAEASEVRACAGKCPGQVGPRPLSVLLGRVGLIVALAGLIGVIHSTRVPVQLELAASAPPAMATSDVNPADPTSTTAPTLSETTAAPSESVATSESALGVRISLEQAHALYDAGTADFIDAREPFEFDPGHIPGAYNLTQADFMGGKTPEALEFLDPARRVVIYCGGGECHASENVAILLQQAGFTSIHIMEDGFPKWVEAGHEVEASGADQPEGGE
jgi:rhodanese-related sulfurtransferase